MYQDNKVCDGKYRFYVDGELSGSAYSLNTRLASIYEETSSDETVIEVWQNGKRVAFMNRACLGEYLDEVAYNGNA